MHNRMPSRRRQSPGASPGRQANTVTVQGETQQRSSPRMPHERDESADSQAAGEPSQRRLGQAAHDDLEQGLVDTDKGPAMDRTYDRLRERARDPVKKFRP